MDKIIIPRKDHEVYFIPLPKEIKVKQLRAFVVEQLGRLHPGFSAETAFDFKRFEFNKTLWIMATVMQTETLAEYKILHKGSSLYTNTSIEINKKNFLEGGIIVIDDELIGFDMEKNEPVSIPLESSMIADYTNQPKHLKNIPSRYGVFVKKFSRLHIAAILTGIIFMLAISAANILPEKTKTETSPVIIYSDTQAEPKYLPHAAEILTQISSDLFNAGGIISRWHYNEDRDPFISLQVRGIDVLTVYEIFSQYRYASLQDIQDARYINGEPNYTLHLNAARTEYTILSAVIFPFKSSTLLMLSDLVNDLKQSEILIVSEIFPTVDNGNSFYTLTYAADGKNLIRSMEIVSENCNKNQLRLKSLDLSINNDRNNFIVECKLSQADSTGNDIAGMGNGKDKIPAAFGYKEKIPAQAAVIIKEPEISPDPETPVIGSIRDGNGKMVFFREPGNGKISLRGSQ